MMPTPIPVQEPTVDEAIGLMNERWPGLRDRLCEPGPLLRHHIRVYVDGEPAELDASVTPRSRVDVIAAISGG